MRINREQTKSKNWDLMKNSSGFTLIEILIAMAIFSIGILATTAMVLSTTRNNTTGNIITQATMLATQKIEELKSTEDVAALESGADPQPIDEQGNPGGIYTRSWTVSDPLVNSNTREVQVIVTYDRLGDNRRVALTTLIRGKGI